MSLIWFAVVARLTEPHQLALTDVGFLGVIPRAANPLVSALPFFSCPSFFPGLASFPGGILVTLISFCGIFFPLNVASTVKVNSSGSASWGLFGFEFEFPCDLPNSEFPCASAWATRQADSNAVCNFMVTTLSRETHTAVGNAASGRVSFFYFHFGSSWFPWSSEGVVRFLELGLDRATHHVERVAFAQDQFNVGFVRAMTGLVWIESEGQEPFSSHLIGCAPSRGGRTRGRMTAKLAGW
jgi:hypothetical protein